jgi:hypothetical protein
MPKDIEPKIPAEDLGKGEDSPKADKPPSLVSTKKTLDADKENHPMDASPPLSLRVIDSGTIAHVHTE